MLDIWWHRGRQGIKWGCYQAGWTYHVRWPVWLHQTTGGTHRAEAIQQWTDTAVDSASEKEGAFEGLMLELIW